MSRVGKIARLPRDIREQLNRRLHEGEQGKRLVDWLNGLPEVVRVLEADFSRRAITEQNLSEWKQGGFREWMLQQEAREMIRSVAADVAELKEVSTASITDQLAAWLVSRFAAGLSQLQLEGANGFDWDLLRKITHDLVALRKGDHVEERLRLEKERLSLDKENARKKTEEEFWAWANQPDIREQICKGFMSREERTKLLGALMFGETFEDDGCACKKEALELRESDQIQPDPI